MCGSVVETPSDGTFSVEYELGPNLELDTDGDVDDPASAEPDMQGLHGMAGPGAVLKDLLGVVKAVHGSLEPWRVGFEVCTLCGGSMERRLKRSKLFYTVPIYFIFVYSVLNLLTIIHVAGQ